MKKTILLLLLLVTSTNLMKAQSAGFYTVSTAANVSSTGTMAWNTPTAGLGIANIINLPPGTLSNQLHLTNFGFNIPAASNVLGVEAILTFCVMPQGTGNAIAKDSVIKLLVNNVPTGNNIGGVHNYTPVITSYTYGNASSTWGASLTPADVNNTNFGFMCNMKSAGTASLFIGIDKTGGGQQISKMKVYYETTTGIIESQTSYPQNYCYNQTLFINGVYEETKLEVFTIGGKKVYETPIAKEQTKVDLSKLSTGIYFYKMVIGKSEVIQKILIE